MKFSCPFYLINFLNIKAIYEWTFAFTKNGVVPECNARIYFPRSQCCHLDNTTYTAPIS